MHARICFNSRQSVSEQLQSLGAKVVSLDMSSLRLGDKPINELEHLMTFVPSSVLYLNLGTNRLCNLKGSDLQRFFVSIAKTKARYVSLHHNALGLVKTEMLLPALAYLFDQLNALDLGHNEFWRKSSVEWRCLFANKKMEFMEYLNLSGDFMLTQGDELIQKMFSLLYLPVRRLSLALNEFGDQKGNDLSGLLRAISPTIKILDLQKNSLHHLSEETMKELEGALPSIVTLYVSSGEINRMSYVQLNAFAKLLPACNQVIAITRANKVATSDKIDYLQSKLYLGKKSATHVNTSPLLDANKHDTAMFLSNAWTFDKLRKVGLGQERAGFFNRLASCIDTNGGFLNDYVGGYK